MGKGQRNRAVRADTKKVVKHKYGKELMHHIEEEVDKAITKKDHDYIMACTEALCLVLHEEFGFDEARLRRFLKKFNEYHYTLMRRYEVPGIDEWIVHQALLEAGIDITQWPEIDGLDDVKQSRKDDSHGP